MDTAPATMEPSLEGKGTNKVANLRAKDGQPKRKWSAGIMIRISPRTPTYISRKINTDSRFATITTPVNASYRAPPLEHMLAKVAGSLDTRSHHAPAKERRAKT
jgi:hypothetical protein